MKLMSVFFFSIFFALTARAVQITASGGSPIPASYDANDSQSKAQECQGNVIEVQNETDTKLVIGLGTSSAIPVKDLKYVPAGPGSWTIVKPKGGASSGQYLYVKSAGSAITSGTYTVTCTYEDGQ